MEAAQALGRSARFTYLHAAREWSRSRSRAFWIVVGVTVVAAALRFATLGVQAYHHDEIVTASRVLRDGFWHAMDAVGFSESAPPLYYALAWLWTQLTGTDEVGLRSLSALFGVVTVPVAYLLGQQLRGRWTGIAAAALVAVNPMLLWYSQEARAYSLLALLTTVATLYFARALDSGRRADLRGWGVFSALALATHYFAIFPIAFEAAWLLWRRGRAALAGLWIAGLAGLLLAPLAIHQASYGHAEWIGNHTLGHRLWETGATFMIGETGDVIAHPEEPLLALVPLLLVGAALALLLLRGNAAERRRGALMLAICGVTLLLPFLLAVLAPGKDYVLARNLLPALVPLLMAVAVAVTVAGSRLFGAAVCGALVSYSLVFCIWASAAPSLQRPDWDSIATRLGEPSEPRAMVTWTLGEAPLRYYLSTGSFQAFPRERFSWLVGEIDFISDGPVGPVPAALVGPQFRQVAYEQVGRLYLRRYATPGPALAPLRLRAVREAALGFHTNGVLLDGIGPP